MKTLNITIDSLLHQSSYVPDFVRIVNFVTENGQNLPNIDLNHMNTIVMSQMLRQMMISIIQGINFLTRQPRSSILFYS
jgi:predicted ATPase